MEAAQLLGFDTFMDLWRLFSSRPELRDDSNQIELHIRPIRSWERYQRNRWFETLVRSGLAASEIQRMLLDQLGERLHIRAVHDQVKLAKQRLYNRDARAALKRDDDGKRRESPSAGPDPDNGGGPRVPTCLWPPTSR